MQNGKISESMFAEFIEPLAVRLSELAESKERNGSTHSWKMAAAYVEMYNQMESVNPDVTTQKVNKAIRSVEGYGGPGSSWLSNAKKIADTWGDFTNLFSVDTKKPYDMYRLIASCSLPQEQKDELREWIESGDVKQSELRMEIRSRVDEMGGRPDFPLKVSNHWKFSGKTADDGFDGGVSPELIANLLYYFTDEGDNVIDPFAGGDTTFSVVNRYRFFSEPGFESDFAGWRNVYRSDIDPINPDVEQADVTIGLPWGDDFADFCIMDPPYYGIAKGKYAAFGDTIEEWTDNLASAVDNVYPILKNGAYIAIMVDDYLRSAEFQPTGFIVFDVLRNAGFEPAGTIYNTYPNFITTMGPAQMWRAKRARMQLNSTKIINVFQKTAT